MVYFRIVCLRYKKFATLETFADGKCKFNSCHRLQDGIVVKRLNTAVCKIVHFTGSNPVNTSNYLVAVVYRRALTKTAPIKRGKWVSRFPLAQDSTSISLLSALDKETSNILNKKAEVVGTGLYVRKTNDLLTKLLLIGLK